VEGPAIPRERLRSWLRLGFILAFVPQRRREFISAYGSLEAAVSAAERDWRRRGLLRHLEGDDIFAPVSPEAARRPRFDDDDEWLEKQLNAAEGHGTAILTFEDARYPRLLRAIPDPPAVLYARGAVVQLARAAVAVVGARRATHYGLDVARGLGRDLASAGLTVVSGGARGVDSAAHRGALEAGGVTVAVMGAGLDVVYPEENGPLFDEIAKTGIVLSEYPFGTSPQPRHFPIRNRVIAGIGLGVVVVEGAEGSGSLITARLAADCGREVFAVPGPITSRKSEGPHSLILEGAKLVRRVDDVLEELPPDAAWTKPRLPFADPAEAAHEAPGSGGESACEDALLQALEAHRSATADELAFSLGMATGDLLAALTDLELRGKVLQLPGGRFARRA